MVLAPLVLLAFVLGLVRDLAQHMDEARLHAVCPEHGELVHIVAAGGHAHAREIRALPVQDHGQDGCTLAELGGAPPLVLPPPIAVSFAPEVGLPDPRPLAVASPSRRPPLEHAPKTSPPARA